ncbi:MAG: transposase [Phycisphaerae bacterium]|nr:transposase [Phycisphaerae bacterium]
MRRHRKSFDIIGDAHCLTFSCFQRQPFFNGRYSPRWFLDAVEQARSKHPFELWAFVIMPEHVHMVILPHEGVKIRTILSRTKHPVTRRALHFVEKNCPSFAARMIDRQPNGKITHRFWLRGGGYDRNLRSVRDVHEKIRYIHENPVRRGLVKCPEDWQWSSASAWASDIDEPIRIDRESLPPLEIL